MNRIYSLILCVYREDIGQLICEFVKKDAVKAVSFRQACLTFAAELM